VLGTVVLARILHAEGEHVGDLAALGIDHADAVTGADADPRPSRAGMWMLAVAATGAILCHTRRRAVLAGGRVSAAITASASATQPNFIAKLRRLAACRSGAKLETASATTVVA
jgi:hypothetical protein